MARLIAAILVAVAASASPALAGPNCLGGQSGLYISYSVGIGGSYTADEQEVFDKMKLRQNGIQADTVERTSLGCWKVTSRDARGHWVTDYIDPRGLGDQPFRLNLTLD
jgi:hypothetical protein